MCCVYWCGVLKDSTKFVSEFHPTFNVHDMPLQISKCICILSITRSSCAVACRGTEYRAWLKKKRLWEILTGCINSTVWLEISSVFDVFAS